jgi:hypothetical protein
MFRLYFLLVMPAKYEMYMKTNSGYKIAKKYILNEANSTNKSS